MFSIKSKPEFVTRVRLDPCKTNIKCHRDSLLGKIHEDKLGLLIRVKSIIVL